MRLMKQRPWVYQTLGILPLALFVWFGRDLPDAAWSAIGLALIAWAILMWSVYLRRLDEMARLAHRWAWEWGGAIGLGAAVLTAMAGWYLAPGLAEWFGAFVRARSAYPEATAFFYGSAFTALSAFALYAVAWTGWWLSKRGGR